MADNFFIAINGKCPIVTYGNDVINKTKRIMPEKTVAIKVDLTMLPPEIWNENRTCEGKVFYFMKFSYIQF